MSLMNEYISKKLGAVELEAELIRLIKLYNSYRKTFLFVYAAALNKPIPDCGLNMEDYHFIFDLLRNEKGGNLDFYIETPGGSGEAAEEIVRLIHSKFDKVTFTISGEAKSAGTIVALSGDEIMMTETGSLGPIDAQLQIGRTVISAWDYMQWVKSKRKEAEEVGKLNPFDATMVAQISPGELTRANHALKFAQERVIEWLPKYKFKNWNVTEKRRIPVTEDHKKARATEIAENLTDNDKWRSHGRAIKIDDLSELLTIKKIDDDEKLADIVYRIQTVLNLYFGSTNCYKVFATADHKLFKNAVSREAVRIPIAPMPAQQADVVNLDVACHKCGRHHRLYAKLKDDKKIDADMKRKGFTPFPMDNRLVCPCGTKLDLGAMRNQIEQQTGRKIVR